jgi:hypothetical protein
MRPMSKSAFVIATILLALATAAPATATSKDKFGCTGAQTQSPKGAACIDKNKDANGVIWGIKYVLYCSSTGKLLCCEINDNGTIKDHSCSVLGVRRPATFTAPPGGAMAPPEGGGRGPFSGPGGSILDPARGGPTTGPAATGNPLSTGTPPGRSTPAPSFH